MYLIQFQLKTDDVEYTYSHRPLRGSMLILIVILTVTLTVELELKVKIRNFL